MKKDFLIIIVYFCGLTSSLLALADDRDKDIAKISVKGSKKTINGRFKAAEKHYSEAIELEPSYELYHKRGCARYENNDLEEALQDFHTAISISPSYAEAYNYRGIVLLELGDTIGALSNHIKATTLNPHYADAYYQCAFVKMQMKNYTEAIADYTKAIRLGNPHSYMFLNRGYSYYLSGKYHEAMKDLEAANRLLPDNPYLFKIKALIEIALGRNNDACISISEALGLGYTEAYGNDLEKIGRKNCW